MELIEEGMAFCPGLARVVGRRRGGSGSLQ
jgi:hypothetical protein